MKRKIRSFGFVAAALFLLAPISSAGRTSDLIQKQEGYIVSLDLKFSRKSQNPLQRVISLLDCGPNGFATGFLVGDGLVMTSYHVVSGDLSVSKKAALGFAAKDLLEVKIYIKGCQATVIKVDEAADLALLSVSQSQKQAVVPAFQSSLTKDDKLTIIARPHGDTMVRRGIFYGPYMFRGQQYWSAKMEARDGYSGSPVYNNKAELVGVFSGYDWSEKLAVISPGIRAQKLLEDYNSGSRP